MHLAYRFLNILFHLAHLCVIGFLTLGWIFPATRPWHLPFAAFVLSLWAGLGYCPLTRWHWSIRAKAGLPPQKGPYIPFLLSRILGRPVDVAFVDRMVILSTILITAASVALNLFHWIRR